MYVEKMRRNMVTLINIRTGPERMISSRDLLLLLQDLSSVPRTPTRQLTAACTFGSRGSGILFQPSSELDTHSVYTHTCR